MAYVLFKLITVLSIGINKHINIKGLSVLEDLQC